MWRRNALSTVRLGNRLLPVSWKGVFSRYRLALQLVLGLTLVGCMNMKSYVLPMLPRVTYGDLLTTRDPRPVVLTVEYQINGVPEFRASAFLRERVSQILTAAHVFSSLRAGAAQGTDTLEIVLNNVGDVDTGSAVLTGLTFGAAGSRAMDGYVMTATFTRVGQPPVVKDYKHALVSTIGNATGPEGLRAMGTMEAFDQVIQDLLLNLILDLQKAEAL